MDASKGASRLAQVTAAFKDLLGRIPSSEELKTYLSARGDAETLVAKTSEYRMRVKGVLDQVHRPLIGASADDGVCDAFVDFCISKNAKPHACERGLIRDFVSTTPRFMDKYSAMVEEVYRIETGRAPDLKTKTTLALRFKDEAFAPSDLAGVIRSGGDTVEDIAVHQAGSEEVHKAVARIENELDFVEQWQRTTGRRIDIYEFLRYYNELGSAPGAERIRAIQAEQDKSFARACKVYAEYLGFALDYDRFTALHVHEYDSPGFADKLVAKIVSGNEYKARMFEVLSESYSKIFDSEIHSDDLDHVFEKVRSAKFSLKSEEISGHILSLGEELKQISDSVSRAFNGVLRRLPDEIETRAAVSPYRSAASPEEAERDLEESLYDEPEYREVLKAIIQEETGLKNNAEVFRVMRKVLADCAGDMRRARDHVHCPTVAL